LLVCNLMDGCKKGKKQRKERRIVEEGRGDVYLR
jgi:hypothetical protein